MIKVNSLLDEESLQAERSRIEFLLRNNGYYHFSRDYIFINGDTDGLKVDLKVILKVYEHADSTQRQYNPYKLYKINSLTFITETDPMHLSLGTTKSTKDTFNLNGISFIYEGNEWVKPKVIQQSTYISPQSLYRASNIDETKRHLSSLNTFGVINIQFSEVDIPDTSQYGYINCVIKLIPLSMQSYTTTLEATTTSLIDAKAFSIGGAFDLEYQHKSLFGNAENFSLKVPFDFEWITNNSGQNISYTMDWGVQATLLLPKFLMPLDNNIFTRKYNPKTSFTLAYNYQKRPGYTWATVNGSLGYSWKQNSFISHTILPLDIILVNLIDTSSSFSEMIKGTYLENSFYNHFVTAISYTYIYNGQLVKKSGNYHYFKWGIETAGNMMYLINSTFNSKLTRDAKPDTTRGYYSLFGIRYSQYVRTELDFHYYSVFNEANTIAYRLYGGIGIPYGNAEVLPYEKQFYAGGSNSMRGWQVRTLGPGSYNDNIANEYPNSTGDMKLEANLEYRFKLFWIMEGALFTDAGNIWTINVDEAHQDALFKFDKFYKDIAVSSGGGLRFLFGYFIFRVDYGLKMRDPIYPEYDRWLFFQHGYSFANDGAFNIAVGYPF